MCGITNFVPKYKLFVLTPYSKPVEMWNRFTEEQMKIWDKKFWDWKKDNANSTLTWKWELI